MKSTYVSDEMFWNDFILTGKVKGYSIGGLFDSKRIDNVVEEFKQVVELTVQDKFKVKYSDKIVDNCIILDDSTELKFNLETNSLDRNGSFSFTDKLSNKNIQFEVVDGVVVDFLELDFVEVKELETVEQPQELVEEELSIKESSSEVVSEDIVKSYDFANIDERFNNLERLYSEKLSALELQLTKQNELLQQKENELISKNEMVANIQQRTMDQPLKKSDFNKASNIVDTHTPKLRVGNSWI
jgi:phosphoenolpyruvate carboxylase